MNEQEKRENVIKGLERCIEKLDTVINKTHGFNCTVCPYFRKCDSSGYLIGLPLMRDALALLKAQSEEIEDLKQEIEGHKDNLRETLDEMMRYADELKAQEPRVMTLEELHRWEETPLRQRNPIFIEFKGTGLTAWRTYFDAVRRVSMGSVRCWTSRPTDEQRKAVKWE